MPAFVWIALTVMLVSLIAGSAFAVIRGLDTLRLGKRLSAEFDAATKPVLEGVERAERKLGGLEAPEPRVQHALDRMRASVAVLQRQIEVVQETRASVKRVRNLAIPRK